MGCISSGRAARSPARLPEPHRAQIKQMAAYSAALGAIYPGRTVEAAVLYTQTPLLVPIPAALLTEHKAGLVGIEESFAR